jgi:3-deoxy-D-manno-octulosonic acid (KDO) 8-phosphate synthase
MSTSETVTPKDAQKARITYLLRIAGANAGFVDSKWTPAVISQLATEIQNVMVEEGMVFVYQSSFDKAFAELEKDAT